MSEISYRYMCEADIPAVWELERRCFTLPWSRKAIGDDLKNPFTRYVVAADRGTIVGYGGMWIIVDEAHITNIAVDEVYRRGGIGTGILLRLAKAALAKRVFSMTLEVRVSNGAAIALYSGLGFEKYGIRKGYYGDNQEDAIIMWNERLQELAFTEPLEIAAAPGI
ncbi:MAG: ribosomal protein S18-alanine N-acetyltransferase [Christensenellales bacterium]|jgi:ribosomal-protein-alanine N-acetyltransferase